MAERDRGVHHSDDVSRRAASVESVKSGRDGRKEQRFDLETPPIYRHLTHRLPTHLAGKPTSGRPPDRPEARVARGFYHYFGTHDFAQALREYRAAQADLPNDAEIFRLIGDTERRLGRWREALANYERSAEFDPRESRTANTRLGLLLYLRRFPEARDLAGRLIPVFPENRIMIDRLAYAQFEIDGDSLSLMKARETRDSTGQKYWWALHNKDYATAERELDSPGIKRFWPAETAFPVPLSLCRATIGYLRGDAAAARRAADQALEDLGRMKVSPRQSPGHRMATAQVHALAGRADEALREASAAMAEVESRDQQDASGLRDAYGQIFVTLGRTDEALDVLRKIFSGASARGPQAIRHHPVWSRLQADPRFEEILRSAKPL